MSIGYTFSIYILPVHNYSFENICVQAFIEHLKHVLVPGICHFRCRLTVTTKILGQRGLIKGKSNIPIRGSIEEHSKIFFLFLNENICCDPSLEPSRRDGSNEGSQNMFHGKIWLIIP